MKKFKKQLINLPKGAAGEQVYFFIKKSIMSLELAPGFLLGEARLAKELGVSRTPIREAIIKLVSEKLVVQLPNRGAMVAPLDLTDLRQYFEALEFAQIFVSGLAAERANKKDVGQIRSYMKAFEIAVNKRKTDKMIEANRDFHVSIAAAAKNKFMYDVCVGLYNQGLRLSRLGVTYDFDHEATLADHLSIIIEQHRMFTILIERHDVKAVEALAREHAELARRRIVGALSDKTT